jgi:cell division septum initiation protein DivIVA
MNVERPTPSAVLRPDLMNAGAVVRSDFSRVRRGGFDPDQVVEHLKRVANHIAGLEARVADLEARLSQRQATGPNEEAVRNELYQKVGARVADLVRSFDEEMERVRANAYSEAETRLSEARAHADRIDRDAEKVRSEAERTAESRRGAMLDDVRRIHEGLQRSAAVVASILQRELDVVVVDETTRPQP